MQTKATNFILPFLKQATQSRVGINAVSNIIGKLWSAALSLLSVPIFLGALGPEAYGLVGLYASFEVIFNFLDLGLSATINREFARNIASNKPGHTNKDLLRTFEFFYWAIGFIVAILIGSLAGWIARNWVVIHVLTIRQVQISIYMMALMFAARWPLTLYIGAFRGMQKQFLQNFISAMAATLRVFIAIILLKYISRNVTVFLSWQAISCAIEILFLMLFTWKILNDTSKEKPHIELAIIKKIWKFALSFNLVGVFGMILSQAGTLVASKFVNLSEIGYYSVANTAAGSLTLIAYSISTAIFPRFAADTERKDYQAVSSGFHCTAKIINYFGFGFGWILILFPTNVLYWWTKDLNIIEHTSLILLFLASAGILNSLSTPGYSLLIASGNTKIPLLCNMINFFIFIPLLVILIPKLGILIAAVVWFVENLISYFVYTISAWKLILKEPLSIYLNNDLIPYLIISLLWFFGGKALCMVFVDQTVQLAIIFSITLGYFCCLAPRLIRDVSLRSIKPAF